MCVRWVHDLLVHRHYCHLTLLALGYTTLVHAWMMVVHLAISMRMTKVYIGQGLLCRGQCSHSAVI